MPLVKIFSIIYVFVICSTLAMIFPSRLIKAQEILVRGKVVDDNKNPVPDVAVTFILKNCEECSGPIILYKSERDGNFSAQADPKRKQYAFTSNEPPKGYWNLIPFPDGQIRYLKRYRGKYVGKVKPNTFLTLPLTINYVKSEVDLKKFFAEKSLDISKYKKIKIETKDLNGRVVSEPKYVPSEYLDKNYVLKITLPKGIWLLSIFAESEEKTESVGTIRVETITLGNAISIPLSNE